jgi:hypothetical protein
VASPANSSFGFGGSAVLDCGWGCGRRKVGRSGNDGFVLRFVMRLQSDTNENLNEYKTLL